MLYKACEENDVGITVMKGFAGGRLFDAKRSPFGVCLTPVQCIHYALTRPAVCSIMCGYDTKEQVDAAVGYEGKKNYYCSNKECIFTMWKNDRFFEERKVTFTPKIAAALLQSGKVNVKKLYSPKTGKTYDGTIVLADTGGKYVNYRVELPKKK